MNRIVRSAAPGDARPAAAVFARAFASDPLYAWILPDERARRRRLPWLFAAQLRAAQRGHDEIDVMAAGQQILGCALWSPPGASRPSAAQQLTVLATFPLILGSRLRAALSAFNAIGGSHPAEPHWYLSTIGVDPPAQRTGVARGLLQPRLARCDQDRVPAALVTGEESNLAYYESLGFAVTGHITVPGGGPPHWAMYRNPKSKTSAFQPLQRKDFAGALLALHLDVGDSDLFFLAHLDRLSDVEHPRRGLLRVCRSLIVRARQSPPGNLADVRLAALARSGCAPPRHQARKFIPVIYGRRGGLPWFGCGSDEVIAKADERGLCLDGPCSEQNVLAPPRLCPLLAQRPASPSAP